MEQFNITATNKAGEITLNFEELKAQLQQELKKYDYEVTEDLIKEAMVDKAHINKFANAIDKRRKEIKNEYCVPLEKFEDEMNQLYNTAKDGYAKLNNQIKAFEEQRKQEKQMEITEYFASLGDVVITLEKIWDSKWLNKGCKDWKEQISSKISAVNEDLDIINSFGISQDEKEEVKGYYLDCLNVSQARAQFDVQKERREQLKKIQEQKQSQQPLIQPESVHAQSVQQEQPQEVQQVKKERILVEFVVEGREFLDYLNEAIKMYKPKVKIIEREEIK